MPYQHLIIKLLRELEEDTVITNPRERSRAFFQKWVYKILVRIDKLHRLLKNQGKR